MTQLKLSGVGPSSAWTQCDLIGCMATLGGAATVLMEIWDKRVLKELRQNTAEGNQNKIHG